MSGCKPLHMQIFEATMLRANQDVKKCISRYHETKGDWLGTRESWKRRKIAKNWKVKLSLRPVHNHGKWEFANGEKVLNATVRKKLMRWLKESHSNAVWERESQLRSSWKGARRLSSVFVHLLPLQGKHGKIAMGKRWPWNGKSQPTIFPSLTVDTHSHNTRVWKWDNW